MLHISGRNPGSFYSGFHDGDAELDGRLLGKPASEVPDGGAGGGHDVDWFYHCHSPRT